jgi:hypothetical protein
MHIIASFFAGAFLCNCIPHLVAGLQGKGFPSPFAKPRGVGFSSPLVNFLWGAFNLIAGLLLLQSASIDYGWNVDFIVMLIGGLALGCYMSLHFGKVMRERGEA